MSISSVINEFNKLFSGGKLSDSNGSKVIVEEEDGGSLGKLTYSYYDSDYSSLISSLTSGEGCIRCEKGIVDSLDKVINTRISDISTRNLFDKMNSMVIPEVRKNINKFVNNKIASIDNELKLMRLANLLIGVGLLIGILRGGDK